MGTPIKNLRNKNIYVHCASRFVSIQNNRPRSFLAVSMALALVPMATTSMYLRAQDTRTCSVVPYYSIRSQGENAARELAGWTSHVNLANENTHYGSFSLTPELSRSFGPGHITSYLFGC